MTDAARGAHPARVAAEWVESRRSDGHHNGAPNPEQREWAAHLVAEGYCHRFAYGWEEAQAILLEYIALPRETP